MAISLDSSFTLLKDRENAIDILVDALKKGYLTLFLGAGISMSTETGFPDWSVLVEKCCIKSGVDYDPGKKSDNKYLRKQIEKVQYTLKENYIKTVKESLFDGIVYDTNIMKTELLISIGSLVMGSIRGKANSLVNYNFDDLIEWYLTYHGFSIQIVSEYPKILKKSDMNIFHPHGFLPKEPRFIEFESKNIIFSQESYLESYSTTDPWNELIYSLLTSNICLLIGLSGEDEHLELLLSKAFKTLKERGMRNLIGYVLLKDNKKNRENEDSNKRRGLINLYVEDHKKIPDFLLSLCRKAANLSL